MNLAALEIEISTLGDDELEIFAEFLRRRLALVDVERWRRKVQPTIEVTYEAETRRLTEQAQICKVARDMVLEDGYPGELVVQVLVAEHPQHAVVIGTAVEEAVTEAASKT